MKDDVISHFLNPFFYFSDFLIFLVRREITIFILDVNI